MSINSSRDISKRLSDAEVCSRSPAANAPGAQVPKRIAKTNIRLYVSTGVVISRHCAPTQVLVGSAEPARGDNVAAAALLARYKTGHRPSAPWAGARDDMPRTVSVRFLGVGSTVLTSNNPIELAHRHHMSLRLRRHILGVSTVYEGRWSDISGKDVVDGRSSRETRRLNRRPGRPWAADAAGRQRLVLSASVRR